MLEEGLLDKILYQIKKLIPKPMFEFFQPAYHQLLAYGGAAWYGFPSRSMKVIGVTGTKGKSTTVYLITKILEGSGHKVAAIGSLGYKINNKEWPNTLKMTMPGRFRLQKFFAEAKKASCKFVVLEVTSEGIKQKRHLGTKFDCAVFTNLHKEHLESHGSFENYLAAKQELFKRVREKHVINADDRYVNSFSVFPAKKKIFYGVKLGDLKANSIEIYPDRSFFEVYGTSFAVQLGGMFNVLNCLAALATAAMYDIDLTTAKPVLESIKEISGRMQFIPAFVKTSAGKQRFNIVVDYAHTPDSLLAVYRALKIGLKGKLIVVLGACGGSRDKWKRPEFGAIADEYADEIILTDEDPYDEDPMQIIKEVGDGITRKREKMKIVLDRKEAIKTAIGMAMEGDTVVITGKGSEISMAVAGGKKIPWSDADIARQYATINP